jgi:hypothetical protein
MAVPVLKLNLAPPSNLWRSNHAVLGWAVLALGALILAGSLGYTWVAYQEAARAGKLAASLANKTRSTADSQSRVLADLRSVDVAMELPRWRLAERIYTERSLPWSRLTSELERDMVQDVRISSIQRNRSADMKVQLKIKGEARSREAEADFVETLQKNPFFEQVILEQESERQGGGVLFSYTLAVTSNPLPYQPLPKQAPASRAKVAPAKAVAAQPAPGSAPVPRSNGIAVPPPVTRPIPVAPSSPGVGPPPRTYRPRFNPAGAGRAPGGNPPSNPGGNP